MTGIQALERAAPGLPMRPGQVERREFEYRRHGTQTLIAGFDVTTGKVGGVVGNTRTEQDFARFLDNLLSSAAPNTRWDIVCDNLDIHLSESVVRLVARHCDSAIKCIPELIEAARESGDKIVIEELRHRGRDMRAQGAKVPDDFSLFVWEWFLDGPPKVKRGPKAYDRLDRDQILAGLVRIVVEEFGFPATRGEPAKESDSTVSACQIVAEETGHEEAAVGEIW